LRRAISGIEVLKRNVTAGDGQMDSVHKIRLWDKTKALDSLAKHLGLMVEKVEHAGTVELVWKE
jgi:phage terminase small subunit